MSKPKKIETRGRPKKRGGANPVTGVRLPAKMAEAIDKWASKQDDEPIRSEAIRRLITIALNVKS